GGVSGGPNGRPGDELAVREIPAGTPPMKCYLDREECYSLNEMTIYWNSSAVFVTAFLRGRMLEEGR
ncbi:MAG: glycoside hydrolase family 9 protein, partial [Acetatifactor sp.]|nr:glycoside hydrolase family 9 protein [Acetatifactor sp.]